MMIGGTLLMIVQGIIYCTGNFTPYMNSYFGCEPSKSANIMPMFFIVSSIFAPFGSWLA